MVMEERKLYTKREINYIKDKYGFSLSKGLGQNFLTDKNIIDNIVEGANITEDSLVIEIGPGIGVLTNELAKEAKKVLAIEIDKKLIPILGETVGHLENVEVLNADILEVDLCKVIEEQGEFGKVIIVGNLPYYITTPIIMKILEENVPANSITIMMQKEVADRIRSGPGSKVYGAISVAVQFYCEVIQLFTVPRDVFFPPPKVDSAVLRLDIKDDRPVEREEEPIFWETIKKGFGQRRKTLLNSLTGTKGLSKEQIKEVLEIAEIEEQRRAETLTIEEFKKIAQGIERA